MSRFLKFIFCLGLLLSHIALLNAQDLFHFKHFNYQTGLSSNSITSIVQDENDFVWIGTTNGLNRYDGYDFKKYENLISDSTLLNDNFISAIANDTERNCLWLVTATGISKLDKTTYLIQNYPIAKKAGSNSTPFAKGSICIDKDNNIWAEGFNEGYKDGIFLYNAKQDAFENVTAEIKGLPNFVTKVFTDNNKNLWIGSKTGLYYYVPSTNSVEHVKYRYRRGEELHITNTYVDEKNNIWIGSYKDNSIYKCTNKRITKFYRSTITSTENNWISTISKQGNKIIVGIRDLGVLLLDIHTKETEVLQPNLYDDTGLKSKTPTVIYNDRFGNIWIGSYNNGINLLDKNQKQFGHYHFDYTEDGLISSHVRALFEDSDGEIWIGTKEGGGISRFHQEDGVFDNFKANKYKEDWLKNDIVISLNELTPGNLLVGTFGSGIYLYNKTKNSFSRFANKEQGSNSISDNNVYALYKDLDGLIWVGNNSYVDIYYPNTKLYTHLNNVSYARCFYDLGESILIGTWSNGLYNYNKKTQIAEQYPLKLGANKLIEQARINGISQDLDGLIWLATNQGLIKLDVKKEQATLFNKEDGLSDTYACAVLVDANNNIWTSTKGGISKLNTKDYTFKNYDKFDGLQSSVFEDFVSLKTKSNYLLFSGANGFNIFHPDSIKDNLNIPKVLITDLHVLNKPIHTLDKSNILSNHISVTNQIELTHEQSSFSFEFVGINYTSSENNQYKYTLEGFDKGWIKPEGNRTAVYTNIPAGDYIFRVKASNNDGIWNNEGTSIHVKVLPSFWKSKAALTIYLLLIILLLLLVIAFLTHRNRQRNKLLKEKLQKERIENEAKSRLNFFTNISHELRTPLTLITAPLENLTNYKTDDEQLKLQISSMNRNAQHLLRLVNQLMDFRSVEENKLRLNISEGDIVEDVKEILHSFDYITKTKQIQLHLIADTNEPIICWYDSGILEKVLFNLISNAIKFTHQGGEISVELIKKENVIIKVKDSGQGIAEDLLDKVFEKFYTSDHLHNQHSGTGIGLAFSKSLISLHKGTITVDSVVNKGTCFTINLPVKKDLYEESSIQNQLSQTDVKATVAKETISSYDNKSLINSETNSRTIMIVEDYDDLREYLINNFSEYKIVACSNGKEALEMAKNVMPDLILSDVMMPKMNGLDLCHNIKTDFVTSHIPVVLLTAKTTNEQKLEGFKHLADAYIEKPFNLGLLKEQVHNLIQLRENIKKQYHNKDEANAEVDSTEVKPELLPLDKEFLDKITLIIESKMMDNEFTVEVLSAKIGMSRSQLFRKFKALMDITPSQYLRAARLNEAANLLRSKEYNVNEVSSMVGFIDVSHFIAAFKKQHKQTPKQFADSQI